MGLVFSAVSECFERDWKNFGGKMSEIREVIVVFCVFPDIDREQLVL